MNGQPLIIFGEVLWDCFADGTKVLGGAPFNVAWHLQAFGLEPLLISRVGQDAAGEKILTAMTNWGMQTTGLQIDAELRTGMVTVTLNNGQPNYKIEYPKAYDYIDSNHLLELPRSPLLYHGSLALRHDISNRTLATLKQKLNPTIFFDVNLRNPWWQPEAIAMLAQDITWLKLNVEELSVLVADQETRDRQLDFLFQQYNLQYILLTAGAAGATLFSDRGDRLDITPNQTEIVVDTVGAGDAFCSILLLGISLNWPLLQTLERAQTFASAIVNIRGATTTDRTFYEFFYNQWL